MQKANKPEVRLSRLRYYSAGDGHCGRNTHDGVSTLMKKHQNTACTSFFSAATDPSSSSRHKHELWRQIHFILCRWGACGAFNLLLRRAPITKVLRFIADPAARKRLMVPVVEERVTGRVMVPLLTVALPLFCQ